MYNKRATLKRKIGKYSPKPTKNLDGIWERKTTLRWKSRGIQKAYSHILGIQWKDKQENTIQSNNASTPTWILNCSDPLTEAISLCKKTIYEAHEKEKG